MPNKEYLTYLKSPQWRVLREQVLARDKYQCFECGARGALEVHHTTYARIFREELDDLITLCPACHDDEHKPKAETVYVKASKLPKRINFAKPKPVTEPEPASKPVKRKLKPDRADMLTPEGRLKWLNKGRIT